MQETCRTCRFHSGDGHEYGDGQCRRHAPQKGEQAWNLVWPHTKTTDWCGDYQMDGAKARRVMAQRITGEAFYAQ